ncbi:MAG: hypothetical protein ACYC9X_00735 [Dehalococcoidia bacterium]
MKIPLPLAFVLAVPLALGVVTGLVLAREFIRAEVARHSRRSRRR